MYTFNINVNHSYRFVLAGVVAFSIDCGQEDVPEVLASIKNSLCFIDYDVKCKHGRDFIDHFDFETKCGTWFQDRRKQLDNVDERKKKTSTWKIIDKYLNDMKPESCKINNEANLEERGSAVLPRIPRNTIQSLYCDSTNKKLVRQTTLIW